jgi:hypothetical protein
MYTDEYPTNPAHGSGGRVDFWPKGDRVRVRDASPDGRWVIASVSDGHGNGYETDARKFRVGNFKLALLTTPPQVTRRHKKDLAPTPRYALSAHGRDAGSCRHTQRRVIMARTKKFLYSIGVAIAIAGGGAASPAAAEGHPPVVTPLDEGHMPVVTPLDEVMPVVTPLDEGHTPVVTPWDAA